MRVLLVDDDIDFRGLARAFLKKSYPRAGVAEYDPEVLGLPPENFPWADYDVVLLDHELRAEHTGLDWLRRYARLPGFPAVIFTTGAGDDNVAARAMKLGADEYLSKRDISAERLGELVSSVMAVRRGRVRDPAAAAPLAEGERAKLSGYVLRRVLGYGGVADIYLAERAEDGLTVVVKLLREALVGDATAIRRFTAEAQTLQAIRCPEVVRVYEYGVERGRAFVAMEYLGHGDLRARIAEGIEPQQALDYLAALARALVAIHERGVVHRDLKPANVMFRYDESLVLTDFGIAKSRLVETGITSTETVLGTPAYISPEQCDGEEVDARSDLYSAGVIFYEMLTGRRPFRGDSAAALFLQHSQAQVPQLGAELASYQAIVDRLLAKRAPDRFPSAAALLQALDGTGEG